MEYYNPPNCELSVLWTKKGEEPQNLLHYIDMEGVDITKLQITLNPNKGLLPGECMGDEIINESMLIIYFCIIIVINL